jgi:DNA segregation ATPase FtsK/SpoIIIE-like protein
LEELDKNVKQIEHPVHAPFRLKFGVNDSKEFRLDDRGNPIQFSLVEEDCGNILVVGITDGGKSNFLKSVCYQSTFGRKPGSVNLLLIDQSKKQHMRAFNGSPYVLGGRIIKEEAEVTAALRWLRDECDRRYDAFIKAGTSIERLEHYNKYAIEQDLPIKPWIVTAFDEIRYVLENDNNRDLLCEIGSICIDAGVRIVGATQRPSASMVHPDVKTHFANRVMFHAGNKRDAIMLSGDEDYDEAQYLQLYGHAIVKIGGKYHHVQTLYADPSSIESYVAMERRSGKNYTISFDLSPYMDAEGDPWEDRPPAISKVDDSDNRKFNRLSYGEN